MIGRPPSPGGVVSRAQRALEGSGRAAARDAHDAAHASWVALRRLVGESDDLTFASSIAYYALLSLFPVLLLLFALLGRVTSDPAVHDLVVRFLLGYFPQRADFIATQLDEVRGASLGLGLAGFVVILSTALGVFRAISSAVNHAWGVERRRSFLRHEGVAFMMLVAAGLVMLIALVFAGVGAMVTTTWFPQLVETVPGLERLVDLAFRYPATVLLVVVVGLIQYFVPNTEVRLRQIWLGALLTGVLWRLALEGFSWYLGLGGGTIHGSIAAIVVFLVWVYVSSVILLYGVEFSAAFAREREDFVRPGLV